jgi:threonine dehydrogenase-like Zn-dependent dehydrogenase
VIAVDLVDERLQRARARGAETIDLRQHDDLGEVIRSMTDGRGPDSVIDAVGMEAHGAPVASFIQRAAGILPDALQEKVMDAAGIDRLTALRAAVDIVRRGGTLSIIGVYGGAADPLPMKTLFDKQIQVRMGQANVKRWVDDILPLLTDDDPLGVDDFATHRLALEEAPDAYANFQAKRDGTVKVLLRP